jgi:hypothetical protein
MVHLIMKYTHITWRRSTKYRSFHPLAFGAAFLVKKSAVLLAARVYGWPRIYRRLAEQTKHYLPEDRRTRDHINSKVRDAIRSPAQVFAVVTDSAVQDIMLKIVKDKGTGAKENMPLFLRSLINAIVDTVVSTGTLKKK